MSAHTPGPSLVELKARVLDLKRALSLDVGDVPATDAGSAHFWSAVAHLELAFNSLTLAQVAESGVSATT